MDNSVAGLIQAYFANWWKTPLEARFGQILNFPKTKLYLDGVLHRGL